MQQIYTLRVLALAFLFLFASPSAAEPAFERTEDREECLNFDWLKQPLFGETHLHSVYSFDATTVDTRNTPAQAYHYAQGGKVGLPPWADTRTEEQICEECVFR